MDEKRIREALKDKQRIVLKIGSSSIIHEETGGADYRKKANTPGCMMKITKN